MKIRNFMTTNVESEKFSTRSIYDASVLLFNNFTKKDVLEMVTAHWDEALKNKLIKTVGV
jgi:hypothetical protein